MLDPDRLDPQYIDDLIAADKLLADPPAYAAAVAAAWSQLQYRYDARLHLDAGGRVPDHEHTGPLPLYMRVLVDLVTSRHNGAPRWLYQNPKEH